MVKYLDLDSVASDETKEVTFRKQVHKMKPTSIGSFIDTVKWSRTIEGKDLDMGVVFEVLVDQIRQAFPTMTDADFKEMTFEQANAVFAFIKDAGGEEIKKAAEAEGNS